MIIIFTRYLSSFSERLFHHIYTSQKLPYKILLRLLYSLDPLNKLYVLIEWVTKKKYNRFLKHWDYVDGNLIDRCNDLKLSQFFNDISFLCALFCSPFGVMHYARPCCTRLFFESYFFFSISRCFYTAPTKK